MGRKTLHTIESFLASVVSYRSPAAVALGVAFGIAIGMTPKDGMLVVLISLSLCLVRAHFLVAASVGAALSLLTTATDRICNPAGVWLLESVLLNPFWSMIESAPFLPWLQWNNSAHLGAVAIAIASYLPAYVFAYGSQQVWNQIRVYRRIDNFILDSELERNSRTAIVWADDNHSLRIASFDRVSPVESMDKSEIVDPRPIAASANESAPAISQRDGIRVDTGISANAELDPNIAPSKIGVARKSDQSLVLVGTIEREFESNSIDVPRITNEASATAELQETIFEIVRFRSNSKTNTESRNHQSPNGSEMNSSSTTKEPPSIVDHSAPRQHHFSDPSQTTSVAIPFRATSDKKSLQDKPLVNDADPSPRESNEVPDRPRDEALRYLLWHLSGVKSDAANREVTT